MQKLDTDERMRRIFGDLAKKMPIKFRKGKQEAKIHSGRKMNFGRNWPERPERAEMT